MINVPVLSDKLAVRAVAYNESHGGYINNIPGTFSREPTDPGIVTALGGLGWTVSLDWGENLSDTHAILLSSYAEYVKVNTINRPRTLGLRFSYKFGDGR
jgi:hypothetical protein